ncbi:MAG: hypothetical protein J5801_02880 [Bacteroidales bacterium]|nr:hypothetical protein [Bacteroidales bacterium]
MKAYLTEIALFGAIFFFCHTVVAQDIEGEIEQMAEAGVPEEAVEEYLQQRSERHRLNLNSASREALERSGLFTPFQIASLLEYRRDYGAILTLQELSTVDGFGGGFAARIEPFVALYGGDNTGAAKALLQVRSRYRYKSGVEGIHQYNRILFEWSGLRAGVLLESDPGERLLTDYIGAYAGYSRGRWNVLLGDFSACFGQGLALWNAFRFTSATQPASLMRRPRGIVPYKSANECSALHGVAVECGISRSLRLTIFASVAGVDAKVGEGGYTSLQVTGYHRTIAEKAARNAMREYLFGGNLSWRGEWFSAGVTALAYTYSKHNARKVTYYNQFQMYDGWMGNLAADAVVSKGHWRLFAEAALSANLKPAAIAGAVLSPSYNFEASASVRYYDKGYIAPHAGAYSTISSVSNQCGAVVSLMIRPLKGLLVTSFSEAVYYPSPRYRVEIPSGAVYERLRAEYASGRWSVSAQDNYVWQSSDSSHKHSLKLALKGEWGRWKGSVRSGAVLLSRDGVASGGMALSASVSREFGRMRHSAAASLSFFSTAGYDTRVYLYEKDLPGSFSSQYYYGKGIVARCIVKIKPCPKLALSCVTVVSAVPECRFQADYNF